MQALGPRERGGWCFSKDTELDHSPTGEPKGVKMRLTAFRNLVGEV